MKKYVSLAGALLLGTVIAAEPKKTNAKVIDAAIANSVIAFKKETNVHPAKK
jgi:hypothetical protein